ncbi:ABC transporter permease subunit [Roseibium sp.]|uniref:ABC transporter permease subunit n=1 Tax=Roseibium sp. TaxID=1936156 RepID=UPI003D0AED2B
MTAKSDNLFMESLKDAAAGGVIALALFSILIGMKAEVASGLGGQLGIEYRWLVVAIAVAVVFGGRLLLNLFVWKSDKPLTKSAGKLLPKAQVFAPLGKFAAPVFLIIAVVLPFLLMSMYGARGSRQYLDLAILVTTYVMLGWGLNIVVGLAGLLDLGYVAFYAVGAYSYALLAHYFGFSFWICLPLAGILASFWGIILGFPVLRLRGDYLAIVTLAVNFIVQGVIYNMTFVGGPRGLNGVPLWSNFHWVMIAAILSLVVIYLLVNSTFGKGITAIREDEIAAELMGVNTRRVKLVAFMVSSFIAGVAGGLLAHYLASINPSSFNILKSTESLVMVYLGGMGSISGSVIAAIIFTLLVEALSPLKILKWVVIPLILILLMLYRPQGLFGNREIKFNLLGGKQAKQSIETITEAGDAAAGD